jgi:hypothetical protein
MLLASSSSLTMVGWPDVHPSPCIRPRLRGIATE